MPGIGRLLGGGERPKTNTNFTAPGIQFQNGALSFTGDTANLASRRPGIAQGFRNLSTEGFSGFRDATLADLGNRQARSTSDLKGRIQRRRLAGSAFAEAELARKRVEDDQQATLTRERIDMAELDFRMRSLQSEAGVVQSAISSALEGAGIAGKMQTSVSQLAQSAFESDRQLLLDSIQGIGALGARALTFGSA